MSAAFITKVALKDFCVEYLVMKKDKFYRITLTEDQLNLVSRAVEDWHRFLCGQCEMTHATAYAREVGKVRKLLNNEVKSLVVPELSHNESYDWSGIHCDNEFKRKDIAMSYMIYREILHYNATHDGECKSWNVYNSETLTCPEQGPLIKIEEIKE